MFSIESIDLEFSNGERRTFERLPRRGREAVIVCAITERHEIILIREYMAGLHTYELGLPKGSVEPGESLDQAANRELKEETGYGARSFTHLHELSLAPGQMGFSIHALLATDLYVESLPGDEPEPLEVVYWPLAKLDELIFSEDLSEARSIATLKMAEVQFARANAQFKAGN